MAKPKTVNISEAKTQFSKLIKWVERGDEIIIARAGHPVARICALPVATKPQRVPGTGKGFFTMTEDFDAPLPEEIQRLFGESLQASSSHSEEWSDEESRLLFGTRLGTGILRFAQNDIKKQPLFARDRHLGNLDRRRHH